VARAVIAQPAYRHAPAASDAATQQTLWELAWRWFLEHVLAPVTRLLHAAGSGGWGEAAGFAVVVAALGALGYVVVRLALAFVRAPGPPPPSSVGATASLEPGRGAIAWRDVARSSAARGDFVRAIAALWSAALATLDERALVDYDPSRTPGEYRRILRRVRPPAAPPFDALGAGFVRAAYGRRGAQAGDFAEAERALDALARALDERVPA